MFGSFGNDLLHGGTGEDTALYDGTGIPGVRINNTGTTQEGIAPFTVDKGAFGIDSLVSIETFHGTQGDDVIYVGGLGDSYTIDRSGNDRVIASQDPNAIDSHVFVAGAGNDTLIGSVQSDPVDYQDSDGFNGPFCDFPGRGCRPRHRRGHRRLVQYRHAHQH